MKTRIIICVSNRPDLLEKQIQLLNNFMIGEKVVSIVYDTRDKQYESFFKKICDEYNLEYHLHLSEPNCAPSFYHAQAATWACLLYTSPSPRDDELSRMPSSA